MPSRPDGPASRPIPFGATLEDAGVRFRLWCPKHAEVALAIEGEDGKRAMRALTDGWHELHVAGAGAGTLYQYVLPDGLAIPDPVSRFQPRDVHGPSEVIDPGAYAWQDSAWRGRPWHEAVLYELHVGAFTPEGTFRAAAERLDALAALGVTAIQMMPVADFPGARGWGYDGVQLYAPDSSYGRPDDLKAFIDAAHQRGLMVLLDVVYNHFGPEGNYLPACAPIFVEERHTPWGAALDFGLEPLRALIVQNALHWIEEYHFDGLRLDAVHAIVDDAEAHVLDEIAARVGAFAVASGREVHLVLENEENRASLLARGADGKPLRYTAQWNDDLHHVLHCAATGEKSGYYADYAGDPAKLARALSDGFVFQGEVMKVRGTQRGEPSRSLPPTAFIGFIQNHDHVGNRAFGERITAIAPCSAVRAIAAIYLLAPGVPMLFMGEEWGASAPFPFFCDLGPDLTEAVREGRRNEFAKFPEFRDPQMRARIPDPTAAGTFRSAKLDWSEAESGGHAEWRDFYRRLIALRHAEIVSRLEGIGGDSGRARVVSPGTVVAAWTLSDGAELGLVANLTPDPAPLAAEPSGRPLWHEGSLTRGLLDPWAVIVTLKEGRG